MRKTILFFLFSLFCIYQISAQQTFHVMNFSDRYSATVFVPEGYEEDDYDYSMVYISVYDKKTGKEILKEESHADIRYELNGGDSIPSNIVEIPYGDQSLIICDDFNCDDKEDLAIKIGNLSCYGGPAYNVYIESENTLVPDSALSELAQMYCGFFDYNCESKEINTMTKSGCCWHQYCTFDISTGTPILKEMIVDDAMRVPYAVKTITTWKDGEETFKEYPLIDYSEYVFSFDLEKRAKKVVVFEDIKGLLFYCFLDKNGAVEFDFGEDFYLSNKEGKDILSFSNNDAKYSIYCNEKEVGILVETNGKTYSMKGDLSSKENLLSIFYDRAEEIENLHIEQ